MSTCYAETAPVADGKVAMTIARRVLFFVVLLFLGAVTTRVYQIVQTPGTSGVPPVGIFAWGMDSIYIVLALWLAARSNIWHSSHGLARAACYVTAFAYGRMLFSATQDWWSDTGAGFRLPGGAFEDYARPLLDLWALALFAWLLIPVVVATAMELSSEGDVSRRAGRFSMSALVGFMTLAAITVAGIRFLTSEYAPRTAFSHMSHADAFRSGIALGMPMTVPALIAAIGILYGLTKRWQFMPVAFVIAIAIDGFGSGFVASVAQSITGQTLGGVLDSSTSDRWLYVCGRSFTVFGAFAVAKLLGVRPTFGPRKEAIRAPIELVAGEGRSR